MKKNTGYWLAFSAGLAVAGGLAYLLTSTRGKKITRKFTERGEQIIDDAEEIISEAKNRFEDLRSDLKGGFRKNRKKNEEIPEELIF